MAGTIFTVIVAVWGVVAILVALFRKSPATPAKRRGERVAAWTGLIVAAGVLASSILNAREAAVAASPILVGGLLLVIAAEIIILGTRGGPLAVERSRVEPED